MVEIPDTEVHENHATFTKILVWLEVWFIYQTHIKTIVTQFKLLNQERTGSQDT
jgi:hypothetical protein